MSSTVSFERFYNVNTNHTRTSHDETANHPWQIVGNEKREATEETYYGIDPSNRRALWEAPVATQKDLDDAVTRANKAFQGWSSSQHGERSRFVKEFADELDKYKAEFARLLSKETGKPVALTRCIEHLVMLLTF
jgi:acyl-CoA reductase-like NAD-dependent aldehyde dehydrogenase